MLAPIFERDLGACNEILDGVRSEHLARRSDGGDARSDDDGEATRLTVDDLALAGVQARSDVESEFGHCRHDRVGAPHRTSRPVETREEAVTGGIDLAPTKADELLPDERVVALDEIAPARVAQFRCALG